MDRTLYFIECAFRSGNAFVEIERHRMSRQQIVDDILHGQYTDVVTVLECNPAEHICDDITEDVLAEVAALQDDEPRLSGQNAQDWKWDRARDYRKHEAAQ